MFEYTANQILLDVVLFFYGNWPRISELQQKFHGSLANLELTVFIEADTSDQC